MMRCQKIQIILGLLITALNSGLCYEKDGKCYKSVNLVIALDASGSINIGSWQSAISISKQIIQSIAIASDQNRFAIIEFSTNATVKHPLNSDSSEAVKSIENINSEVQGGHTYLDAALNEAIKIFDSVTASQEEIQNILITISDGFMTYRDGKDILDILRAPVQSLLAKQVKLYAVSVGDIVKVKTLHFIAEDSPGSASSRLFPSDQVANLIENIKKGTVTECPKIACTNVNITRVGKGCYKDNQQQPRPLPDLTFTARDSSSRVYSRIVYDTWESYIKQLVCKCAEEVAKQGRHIFGLQYYGECWSSTVNTTYARDGAADDNTKCASPTTNFCNSTMLYCVGTQKHNFVYKIIN